MQGLFVERSRVIHEWLGDSAVDQFGWTVRRMGDLDGDGEVNFVSTAPTYKIAAGKIYVFSSKAGKDLFAIER